MQASRPSAAGCAYTLKTLVQDLPLSDNGKNGANITCVEYWEANLYIGTSAGELLHFVSLPSEDLRQDATFILASRLEPTPITTSNAAAIGVQKILIIPASRKACILSNHVLTFHSLPELSPAAGNRRVSACQWIGGLDMNLQQENVPGEDIIMIGLAGMIRILRIGDEVKSISKISFPKCLEARRHGKFACVADDHHYALLDVENQQKIPLFPISSIDETPAPTQVENLGHSEPGHERNASIGALNVFGSPSAHRRQQSLGDRLKAGLQQAQLRSGSREPATREEDSIIEIESETRTPVAEITPETGRSETASPRPAVEQDKPLPQPPQIQEGELEKPGRAAELLKPHILSPLADEFLLATGTGSNDPGVGMFVSLDGDVVRGTLEFGRYPATAVVDTNGTDVEGAQTMPDQSSEGYVLAAFAKQTHEGWEAGIEVQRWDTLGADKSWISLTTWAEMEDRDLSNPQAIPVGVLSAFSTHTVGLQDVSSRLKPKRLNPKTRKKGDGFVPPSPVSSDEDEKFWGRLDERNSRLMCWSGNRISLLVKTPLVTRLEALLEEVTTASQFHQDMLLQLVGRIQNMDVTSEADFLSLAYMRQKISLVAFEDLVANKLQISPQISEKLFVESDLDPRVIISMIPLFHNDIDEGTSGIRLSQGLVNLIEERLGELSISLDPDEVLSRPDDCDVLGLIKRYLFAWRKKKGFGSIADETHVFASVDAALLHLILHQDSQSGLVPGQIPTLRAELYALVDQGVSCPERAIELLEEYQRLYALSRLYGNRRESAKVLQTWRRIMEGEGDIAGELSNPDAEMRKYLGYLRDRSLIEEYGAYLARRDPSFGVQVFTDESNKIKLPPEQIVKLLETKAPDAVKVYLEHLVFGKKNFEYANDLISYYLNSVLAVLNDSEDDLARNMLERSYQSYRALSPPKPTYRQFISENAVEGLQWWNDRLRLLELLGGTFGADFKYDIAGVQARIKDYSRWLVPESIILDGRQGNHLTALRLLTHGLGDYHTAVNYCMLGGASIFHPAIASAAGVQTPDKDEQRRLFSALLYEFLKLEDDDQQREQAGILLARFEGWFTIEDVLPIIPESWPLEAIERFLIGAIRRIVQEKAETTIVKALSGAENIIVAHEFAEKSQSGEVIVMTESEQMA